MGKAELRQQLLTLRNNMEPRRYEEMSLQVQRTLLGTKVFQNAKCLALYSPIYNEAGTEELFLAASGAGKQVCYPQVVGRTLRFCRVRSLDELSCGAFNVLEPCSAAAVNPQTLDLMVLPGIAFDFAGRRLGYGQGFYDRFLADNSVNFITVGLGFDFQLKDSLPEERHDRKVGFVATESRFIPCRELRTGLI